MSDLYQCYITIKTRLLNRELKRLQEKIEVLKRAQKNLDLGNESAAIEDLVRVGVLLGEWDEYDESALLLKFLIKKIVDEEYGAEDTRAIFEYEFTPYKFKDHDYFVIREIKSFPHLFSFVERVEESEVLTELDRVHIYYVHAKEGLERLVRNLERLSTPHAVRESMLDDLESYCEWTAEEKRKIKKCVENKEFFELIKMVREKISEYFDTIAESRKKDLDSAKSISSKLGVNQDELDFDKCRDLILNAENLGDLKGVGNLVGFYLENNPDGVEDLWPTYIEKRDEIVHKLKRMGYDGWKEIIEETNDPKELAIYYFELCYYDELSENEREELWSLIEEKLGLN